MAACYLSIMPELPEVETVCRGLAPILQGAHFTEIICRRRSLRYPFPKHFPNAIMGVPIVAVARRAKYILIHFANQQTLLLHLGMSGRLFKQEGDPQKHDHILFTLSNGHHLKFNDARRFGMLDLVANETLTAHPWLAHLGAEPFAKSLNPRWLYSALQKRKAAIKPSLMDQELWVGVGNIYASEALFMAKILPTRPAQSLSPAECGRLLNSVRSVLRAAIKAGGTSLRDYVQADGAMGYFQTSCKVYGRKGEACLRCAKSSGFVIQSIQQAGRSSFFCAQCQV